MKNKKYKNKKVLAGVIAPFIIGATLATSIFAEVKLANVKEDPIQQEQTTEMQNYRLLRDKVATYLSEEYNLNLDPEMTFFPKLYRVGTKDILKIYSYDSKTLEHYLVSLVLDDFFKVEDAGVLDEDKMLKLYTSFDDLNKEFSLVKFSVISSMFLREVDGINIEDLRAEKKNELFYTNLETEAEKLTNKELIQIRFNPKKNGEYSYSFEFLTVAQLTTIGENGKSQSVNKLLSTTVYVKDCDKYNDDPKEALEDYLIEIDRNGTSENLSEFHIVQKEPENITFRGYTQTTREVLNVYVDYSREGNFSSRDY